MKLYIKQKVFSWKDRFTVKDAYGADRYTVEGKVFSIGKKLFVYNAAGDEVAYIREKVPTLLPKFMVEIGGTEVAEIVKKFSFLKPKYEVHGPDWTVQGDFFAHDYTIMQGELPVVTIHKQWMSWGDSYEIDIADPSKELTALGVVLAIDAVLAAQSAAAASST